MFRNFNQMSSATSKIETESYQMNSKYLGYDTMFVTNDYIPSQRIQVDS